MPGVWEVRLSDLEDVRAFDGMQAEKDEPVPPTAATLTVSALAVEPAPQQVTADAMLKNSAGSTNSLSLSNRMASFEGAIAGMPIGAARRENVSIRHGQQLQYEFDVPKGATALLVKATEVVDTGADLDLYLLDCTGKECRNPQTDSDPLGDEVVTAQNPAAGKWKVVIDAATVPSGSTTFAYADVIFSPAFGVVSTSDVPGERKVGELWSTQTHTWLAGTMPAGREAFPAVLLQGHLSGNVPFGLGLLELLPPLSVTSTQR
jgi:hypothetical protein